MINEYIKGFLGLSVIIILILLFIFIPSNKDIKQKWMNKCIKQQSVSQCEVIYSLPRRLY